jgi:hypothetical protein
VAGIGHASPPAVCAARIRAMCTASARVSSGLAM